MTNLRIMEKCFCCRRSFQMGPGRYDGKFIPAYQILVCQNCYDGNWDGWAPVFEERILKHLNEESIAEPSRNSKGFLPRDG